MLKKLFTILIVLVACKKDAYSQNLVPNPGFEEYELVFHPVCNNDSFPVCKLWYSPTNGSPDYFNEISCFSNYNGIPQNGFGFQYARTGNAYYGLMTFVLPYYDGREYIQSKLLDSLKKNKKYCVEFYISLEDSIQYAMDVIGAYFSDTAVTHYDNTNIYYLLPFEPQVYNPHGNIITGKQSWTLISGSYTARGGEQYITIGNFFKDINTNVLYVGGGYGDFWDSSAYYIDDVSVEECPPEADTTAAVFSVYPSLASEIIYLDYNKLEINNTHFILNDIRGRKVKELLITEPAAKQSIDVTELSEGMYFYGLVINGNKWYGGKVVVAK